MPALAKPEWIRVRVSFGDTFRGVKRVLREQGLHTVCEEAACPNIGECFGMGTATFMVLGDLCTRRCPFCDVAHGRPSAPDPDEPLKLAHTVARLRLNHVVITSVDRDDLRDGGARTLRLHPGRGKLDTRIETLTPDFRAAGHRTRCAAATPPDVLNHNLETVPRRTRGAPGRRLPPSLELLRAFKQRRPLRVGPDAVGETDDEVIATRAAGTPTHAHDRPVSETGQPAGAPLRDARRFDALAAQARQMGFKHAACGPLVRSSYHADRQAQAAGLPLSSTTNH